MINVKIIRAICCLALLSASLSLQSATPLLLSEMVKPLPEFVADAVDVATLFASIAVGFKLVVGAACEADAADVSELMVLAAGRGGVESE